MKKLLLFSLFIVLLGCFPRPKDFGSTNNPWYGEYWKQIEPEEWTPILGIGRDSIGYKSSYGLRFIKSKDTKDWQDGDTIIINKKNYVNQSLARRKIAHPVTE